MSHLTGLSKGLEGFVYGTLLQVGNTEALNTGIPVLTMSPNFSLIAQPLDLISGNLPASLQGACILGWGVEIISFIAIVGLERAWIVARRSHPIMGKIFLVLTIGVLAWNVYSDYSKGPSLIPSASYFIGHGAYCLLLVFFVVFCGVIGIAFLTDGRIRQSRPAYREQPREVATVKD